MIDAYTAGATISQGDFVFLDGDQQLQLSNSGAVATAKCLGVALSDATVGFQALVASGDEEIIFGVALAFGYYVLATVDGGMQLMDSMGSGENLCVVGVANNAGNLDLGVVEAGFAKP